MSNNPSGDQPSILYERSKLLIMTALVEAGESLSFRDLAEETQLTNGNLSSHLRKLEELKFVKLKKQFVDRRPLTTVEITEVGRAAFKVHINSLKAILERVKK